MNKTKLNQDYFNNINGAVYIPSRAYNAYQMWMDYNSDEIKRDMGYAKKIGLNSLRIWISYEFWKTDKDKFKNDFEDFLSLVNEAGMRIMPSLFENCGRENTPQAYIDRNFKTATAFKSPGKDITDDETRWDECYVFVKWFMKRYKDDERLLAIEIMNEPHIFNINKGGGEDLRFARAMFKCARDNEGIQPLTIGCMNMEDNLFFMEYGIDIMQCHNNFPSTLNESERYLQYAKATQDIMEIPVWLTEWQRLREKGPGWDNADIPEKSKQPKLSSLVPLIRKYNIGNFFWSLMLKPAYLPGQRLNGTFNGIFHEDGAVYSIVDANAIAGYDTKLAERKEKPNW